MCVCFKCVIKTKEDTAYCVAVDDAHQNQKLQIDRCDVRGRGDETRRVKTESVVEKVHYVFFCCTNVREDCEQKNRLSQYLAKARDMFR